MNIVCNNCGGADIYNLNKVEFNNPFIWCAIFADDMITLIKNWNNINFNNYKLIRLSETIAKENNYDRFNPTITGILLDDKIKIFYTHYLYGNYSKPTKIGADIIYNKNYEYAYKKFETRLKRMIDNNEAPIFLIFTYKRHGWTQDKIEKLLTIDSKYKIILITDMNIINAKNNFKIIRINNLDQQFKLPLDAIKNKKNLIYKEIGI